MPNQPERLDQEMRQKLADFVAAHINAYVFDDLLNQACQKVGLDLDAMHFDDWDTIQKLVLVLLVKRGWMRGSRIYVVYDTEGNITVQLPLDLPWQEIDLTMIQEHQCPACHTSWNNAYYDEDTEHEVCGRCGFDLDDFMNNFRGG